ncbi:hypothetical protein PMG11_11209 [Penicillium brasilianum]|uniref:NACHT domain-containing protein n=1 Tax=Penicillium brasilianum TaxID=104259 RepID=A0A0F7U5I4_PENBI|nr:hypothetical protein PMG11_11209 [Penicillium brasilianum]
MATNISYDGPNSGLQIGHNHGDITAHFSQSETSLNQACLRDLRTTNPDDDKERIEKTNGGLFQDSYRWIWDNEQFRQWQDNKSGRLLWIKGDPGKGKTMLLCGIIDELTRSIENDANICFFFCQATDVRINHATAVLRGLIYSLVERQPSLLSHVRSRYDQAGKTLFEDINAWNALSKIFGNILKDPTLHDTYFVIDALDECMTDLPFLLDLIGQLPATHSHVKWIVSSRNWPSIEERFDTAIQAAPISLELNEASISNAVQKFIRHKVYQLAKVKKYQDDVRDTVYRYMLSHSQGTFLWVALVCQYLNRTSRRHVLKKLKEFPPGLDALYGRMIDQVQKSEDADICKRILAVMSMVYRPVNLEELITLIEMPDDLSNDHEGLMEIIAICGSFLTLRENIVVFVHQSAKEFLLERARIEVFSGDNEDEHLAIFSRCLQIMFETLRRNILETEFGGISTDEIKRQGPKSLAAAKYAFLFWVDHLQRGWRGENNDHSLSDGGNVDGFLEQKYLNWLEVLGIFESVPEGIRAMLKLKDLLREKGNSRTLQDRAQDASRFIQYYSQAIESCPFQVYSSGLIFSPNQSITRTCYQKEKPGWILNSPAVDETWSLCLQTLEGHSNSINLIVWSPDGSRLASASIDKTVRIWDSATGQCSSTLEGHSDSVNSIAWSTDGSKITTASGDKTIKIWDPATGQCASTLQGHSDWVNSVAWAPDGSRLASASDDKTVRIWDSATGYCGLTLHGHGNWVNWVAWSPDRSRLASASNDKTIRLWDAITGQCELTLRGHSTWVNSVAWSPNGSRLVSASDDATIRIWDPATGQCASLLKGHSGSVTSITWSPDGGRLASASDDKTIRIWDAATGQCAFTLEGHSRSVQSIAWSPNGRRLASVSDDTTARIWDMTTGDCASTLQGHRSDDKTVKIWDSDTGQFVSAPEGHSEAVTSIAWSPNGSRLASASSDKTVRIWDPSTGKCASTLQGHSDSVRSISWSLDGSRLASASDDTIVSIWNPDTGQRASTLEGHSGSVTSIAWSPRGNILASASGDKTVRIWDLATRQCMSILQDHGNWVSSIAWSPEGSRLASASYDNSVKIWDAATSQCTFTLQLHSQWVNSIAWSPDGSRLASASGDKSVRIWDPDTGQCASTLEGHSLSVQSIAWSPDGSRLASASYDDTVRIWDRATSQCTFTLDIHSPNFLQFDKAMPENLQTNVGTFNLGSSDPVASKPHCLTLFETHGYGLSDDSCWITYNGLNLLWLPAEYRSSDPSLFAKFAPTVAIGCSSGRVIFLVLAEYNHLSTM